MKNIAVYSNEPDKSILLVKKLNVIYPETKDKLKPEHFNNTMFYLCGLDIMVSGLNLEMHYPQYNMLYVDEFIKKLN